MHHLRDSVTAGGRSAEATSAARAAPVVEAVPAASAAPATAPRPRRRLLLIAACLLLPALALVGPALAATKGTKPTQPAAIKPVSLAGLRTELARPGAQAVLLNVWASWCDPCREEMPDLVKVYRQYKDRGLRLVLVSADAPADRRKAAAFLASVGVDFPTWLKNEPDQSFIDGLDKRWSGALPASFLFDGRGQARQFWPGPVTAEALGKELDALLGGAPASVPPPQKGAQP